MPSLTPTAGFHADVPDTIYEHLDIRGMVSVYAPNVSFRYCRFTGQGEPYGVLTRGGSVLLDRCELTGDYTSAAIAADDWTAIACNLHHLPVDGVKLGSNTLLQHSCIHHLIHEDGEHADGVQLQNGVVNAQVRSNWIDVPDASAAMFLAPDLGPSTEGPLTIRGNYLNGGNYTFHCVDGGNGRYFIAEIEVAGNWFGPDHRYGAVHTNVPISWYENRTLDGALLDR